MNDKLKEELQKTRYTKPNIGGLFGWIVAIVALSFFFFIIPPFKDKSTATSTERTLPKVREVVRRELDKHWSEPITPPPGKCGWYQTVNEDNRLSTSAQKKVTNGWEYVDLGKKHLGHTNRFRATYEYSYMMYEFRNPGDCVSNMRTAPGTDLTVRWILKPFWSTYLEMKKGTCLKWWSDYSEDDYAVQTSTTWASDNFKDVAPGTDYVEYSPNLKTLKIRFGGRGGKSPTIFYKIRSAGQCRD